MNEVKNLDKAEWLVKHTLTEAQFKQLIENKLVRAQQHHEALKRREALCRED